MQSFIEKEGCLLLPFRALDIVLSVCQPVPCISLQDSTWGHFTLYSQSLQDTYLLRFTSLQQSTWGNLPYTAHHYRIHIYCNSSLCSRAHGGTFLKQSTMLAFRFKQPITTGYLPTVISTQHYSASRSTTRCPSTGQAVGAKAEASFQSLLQTSLRISPSPALNTSTTRELSLLEFL